MACLVHSDCEDTLGAASDALQTWIAEHNLRVVGPLREIYLRFAPGRPLMWPD